MRRLFVLVYMFCCVHLPRPRKKMSYCFASFNLFPARVFVGKRTLTQVPLCSQMLRVWNMELTHYLIWIPRNGCMCCIRSAYDRNQGDRGECLSMLCPRAPILVSLVEVRAGWAAPPGAAVPCFFRAHQGHCVRAVQAAAMTYHAMRQTMALLVAAPLTKA